MDAARIWPTKEYIWKQQSNIVEYINNLSIYELCKWEERMQESIRFIWW